jgi:hypothetical protein
MLAVLASLPGLLVLPAASIADAGGNDTGGAGISSSDSGTTTPAATSPGGTAPSATAQPADATTTVSGGGFTLTARTSALLRHQVRFTGTVDGAAPGATILVQRFDHAAGWVTATTGTVGDGGYFVADWKANRVGQIAVRAISAATAAPSARTASASTHRDADSPTLRLLVYRPSLATTYGDGFFGQRTACGQVLHHGTLGVANRTLKCGTLVSIYYGGRSIVVPVIDRGPYANGADWDLTSATASALGVDGTATIGAVTVHAH